MRPGSASLAASWSKSPPRATKTSPSRQEASRATSRSDAQSPTVTLVVTEVDWSSFQLRSPSEALPSATALRTPSVSANFSAAGRSASPRGSWTCIWARVTSSPVAFV